MKIWCFKFLWSLIYPFVLLWNLLLESFCIIVTCSKTFLPMFFFFFPPLDFTVLGFIFKSVVHLELIFVNSMLQSVDQRSPFFFFCKWIFIYCRTICQKDYPFSTELPLHLCQKSVFHICVGLFVDFPFCAINLFVLIPIPYCVDLLWP